ncbi:MAG: hypothetical protein Q9217_001825 [Psora testacea]
MALSESDRGNYDPKAHLQPSIDEMELDRKSYEPPLHNEPDFHKSPRDTTTSFNTSAHQANGTPDTHDFAPPTTNGFHSTQSPVTDTQTSVEPTSSLPASVDTAATHESLPPLSSPPAPEDIPRAKLDEAILNPAPPVIQQPTSDVREEDQPHFQPVESEQVMETQGEDQQHSPLGHPAPEDDLSESMGAPIEAAPTEVQESTLIQDAVLNPRTQTELESAAVTSESPTTAPLPIDGAFDIPTIEPSDHPPVSLADGASTEATVDPAPSPAAPTDTSAPALEPQESSTDQVMQDTPAVPPKVARPREEDEVDTPAAKRAKTEEEAVEAGFKVPERPAIDTQVNGTQPEASESAALPMTKLQQQHLRRSIGNVKRIFAAKSFLVPVDPVALKIPTYFDIIKHPMDLKTLEDNLRANKYPTVEACVADFNQIVQNAQIFNGPEHLVTIAALAMKASFDKHMESIPSSDIKEPAPSKKKAPDPMAIRAPPARRESRSSLPGSARSPISAGSPQAFALGPDGIPLIRRDSTLDGRPKREIHRPAPRDLPYTHQKPKKKKFQWELRFCDQVLKEISKPKYTQYSFPFMQPVDPVALNIPTYLSVVKKPMDFGSMRQKLDRGEYENAKEFEADARQVFKNCYAFNPENDTINNLGHKFESIFNDEWSKKREWLDENTPSSGQRSADSSEEDESEEDDEEEVEDDGQMEIVSKLQKQIAEMSKQVELITGGGKKNKTPPAAGKKVAKASKATKKDSKKATAPAPKAEKKTAPKAAKKEKVPYVTYEQKQDISNRINSLSESKMSVALGIIRNNMPNLKGVQEDELELDIDELSNDVLYKLLVFVRKHAPRADDSPVRPVASSSSAAPARKKNKPMSKHEQEARIAQVQSGLSAFQKGASSGSYPDVQASIEQQESDDDEDDEDSESEEE